MDSIDSFSKGSIDKTLSTSKRAKRTSSKSSEKDAVKPTSQAMSKSENKSSSKKSATSGTKSPAKKAVSSSAEKKGTSTKKMLASEKESTSVTVVSELSQPKSVEISHADIGVRAFLVWEKRNAQGLPGDESSDWIEAERQLREERLGH